MYSPILCKKKLIDILKMKTVMIQMRIKANGSDYILLNHMVQRLGNKIKVFTEQLSVFDWSIDEKVLSQKE
jgi:hypothetical protein